MTDTAVLYYSDCLFKPKINGEKFKKIYGANNLKLNRSQQ